MIATAISTSGYITGIGSLQWRQRARSTIQLTTGMLSYHAIRFWQRGQRDRGRTTDCSDGQRAMHTFRNEPINNPSTVERPIHIKGGSTASSIAMSFTSSPGDAAGFRQR